MLLVHWHEPINVEVFPTVVSIKNGIMEVSYGELNPVSKKLESYNSYYVILYHNIQNFEDKSGMEKVLFFGIKPNVTYKWASLIYR